MLETTTRPDRADAYRLGGLALLIATGIILAALGFEILGGYAPCPLCRMQRYAFYAGIPLTFVAMALVAEHARIAALLFFAVALGFLANAGLAAYHTGVEWHFWPGPDTCATAQNLPTNPSELLQGLENTRVVRCDEAPWHLFGLSFAGWNVIISLALFAILLQATFAAAPRD
jgi:disulfide bond formation protein DsbB